MTINVISFNNMILLSQCKLEYNYFLFKQKINLNKIITFYIDLAAILYLGQFVENTYSYFLIHT